MPFQSKTGVAPQATPADVGAARRLLNLAGRGVDAAFRSLTLDTLMVRGKLTVGQLQATSQSITGEVTVSDLTVTGSATIDGALGVAGNGYPPIVWVGSTTPMVGSLPGPTNRLLMQGGDTVSAVDSGSNILLSFSTPFPNALLSFQVMNGDTGVDANIVFSQSMTLSLSQVSFRAWKANTNTGFTTGTNVRFLWLAVGW